MGGTCQCANQLVVVGERIPNCLTQEAEERKSRSDRGSRLGALVGPAGFPEIEEADTPRAVGHEVEGRTVARDVWRAVVEWAVHGAAEILRVGSIA